MLRIRKWLLVLAVVTAILTLSNNRYGFAMPVNDDQARPVEITRRCVCGGYLSFQWPLSDKSEDYYLQKWKAEDRAYNSKLGFGSY